MPVIFKTAANILPYSYAIKVMKKHVNNIINGSAQNVAWFLEHNDVYTKGSSSSTSDILSNPYNIDIIETDRGGRVTFHGPGQRVVYLMLKLKEKDVIGYIKILEGWLIDTLLSLDVKAYTISGNPGVWVKVNSFDYKIASLGIRIKKWVAYHGVALNVNNNLEHFDNINACGLQSRSTSLQQLGISVSLQQIDDILKAKFSKHFQLII